MRKGRFHKSVADVAQRYSESVSFDHRLYRHDIAGSIAHAAALTKAGIISAAEQKKIETGLRVIEQEIESGKFQWDGALEDAHMNIESALTKKIGVGGRRTTVLRSPDQWFLRLTIRLDRICRFWDDRKSPKGALHSRDPCPLSYRPIYSLRSRTFC